MFKQTREDRSLSGVAETKGRINKAVNSKEDEPLSLLTHTSHAARHTYMLTSYFQPPFLQNLMACSGVLKVSCRFDMGSAVLVHPIIGLDHRSCNRHSPMCRKQKTSIREQLASL